VTAPPPRVLDAVRESCAFVAAHAAQVQIDAEALRRYGEALPIAEIAKPASEPAVDSLADDPELRAAFSIALDCVNFGSGYFPLLRKPAGHSGYRTVEAALRARFAAKSAVSAAELAEITPADCAALFGQTLEGPVGELMARFAQAWRELGAHLLAHHGGSFLALARASSGSAEHLVGELAQLASYRDVAEYRGREIWFLKRAQISAADLALAVPGLHFADLHRLTMFADNLVPHVLRMDGVLRYDAALLARIEAEEPLAARSRSARAGSAPSSNSAPRCASAATSSGRTSSTTGCGAAAAARSTRPGRATARAPGSTRGTSARAAAGCAAGRRGRADRPGRPDPAELAAAPERRRG
jgi:hypothetical protein